MSALQYVHSAILPAAAMLLPAKMDSKMARAMLLAIGLQESRFEHRFQIGGAAVGFWQFERGGGVRGVLTHRASQPYIEMVLDELRYDRAITTSYQAIAHNDVLAAVYARLLLWTSPRRMPGSTEIEDAWEVYMDTWRPGKPHHETWEEHFLAAWELVESP